MPDPYQPRGACWQLLHCQAPELLISGPAGTGKSRACLTKLHLLAEHVPGSRHLICRKTRASLTESVLVTWEKHVIPPGHPILEGPRRTHRQAYHYPNGSEVVLAGMDKPSRALSTEYDSIYIPEAVELAVDEWETLCSRLRHGKVAFQQLIADTNPDRPTHWLKRRCDASKTLLLESRHEDNPLLWNGRNWTPFGLAYLAKLDALTGPRKLRLRYGRWVQAEGVVYEAWDPAVHLIDRFEIPNHWPRVLSIDFGYTNAFVCQWWAIDPDGRLYRYREIYHTKRLVEDHAEQILELSKDEPPPVAVICDHDAEDRATLERHLGGVTPALAVKWVRPGIEAVQARLRPAGDRKPRLYLLRDSLVERDPELDEAKKPACTEEELDGYIWHPKRQDEPVKVNDHGCDALRYAIATIDLAEETADEGGVTVLVG